MVSVCGVTTFYVEKSAFYKGSVNGLIFNKRYWNTIGAPNWIEEGMFF